jgi:hypothetical protein
MLVREGEAEGFVTDEIPATQAGCPIAWRPMLQDERTSTNAMVSAWFADRPEFTALAGLGRRVAGSLAVAGRQTAALPRAAPSARPRDGDATATTTAAFASRTTIVAISGPDDSVLFRAVRYPFTSTGSDAGITLVTADSTATAPRAQAAQAVFARVDSLMGSGTARNRGLVADAAADTMRASGVRDALIDVAGSMVALGSPAHTQHWDIGIRDPHDPTPCFAHLRLRQGQAISTVGEYEQFVVAERSAFGGGAESPARRSIAGLVSVTVLASNAVSADSTGAVLLALGPADAKRLAHKRADLSVILIERGADGVDVIWVESDLREWLTLDDQCGARLRVEYY